MYKQFIRPFLFLIDPESVHDKMISILSGNRFYFPLMKALYEPPGSDTITVAGMEFRNRLGLAAGFDKNGVVLQFLDTIGFSHAEVGTVTPKPQPGNSKPRIFRLKKDSAIINRLGFNNQGVEAVKRNIAGSKVKLSTDFIVGVNIGKNKQTEIANAVRDYKICFQELFEVADYFTINISSPNTEGLRKLQDREYLNELLETICSLNDKMSAGPLKPVFVKIAPDLSEPEIELIFETVIQNKINGIVATNTTISREGLMEEVNESGGLSGKPLFKKSSNVLKKLSELNSENIISLIGVGGVFDKESFNQKVESGASIVQIYTGLIYEGPGIIKKILT
ncbi:MAG: quinone-dependent dihydroorotate dehydrogenase [Ignavibacteriaceae bacterium]|nr:MAG: quinone-dependent dihydroorotate dehydrogenase [Chlorobiota bacterium]MBV6398202.1 Dihydroorotate dehydrogenase (quinone) [Ignavibacteria bacterium]MCC6885885.1 quinone-dependent dihydroorotate dehydrogenase [Ignavibacteriales bacterium]MCE7953458.1 quinone-dependent dihydroorotate dehydrogenase [Chlorobi bacterium CHB7]MDL1887394.1 quinone-dependent dihydroorotate dehydrogenase [Ignavibacteria bacterium CHB1]MEB2330044.1 quinone-dependent dihydroorotate dehydrogenase [Ignavibacteriace